jgi:hypothetical protein
MLWDIREPCASCPYRKDVPVETWHRSEFEGVMANAQDEMRGAVFGCHKYRNRPKEEHRPCVGWFLDQKANGMPSIQLRLLGMTGGAEAVEFLKEAHDGGHDLYSSIEEMCEANGADEARHKHDNDDWENE